MQYNSNLTISHVINVVNRDTAFNGSHGTAWQSQPARAATVLLYSCPAFQKRVLAWNHTAAMTLPAP
jgi:hypothetical protein